MITGVPLHGATIEWSKAHVLREQQSPATGCVLSNAVHTHVCGQKASRLLTSVAKRQAGFCGQNPRTLVCGQKYLNVPGTGLPKNEELRLLPRSGGWTHFTEAPSPEQHHYWGPNAPDGLKPPTKMTAAPSIGRLTVPHGSSTTIALNETNSMRRRSPASHAVPVVAALRPETPTKKASALFRDGLV